MAITTHFAGAPSLQDELLILPVISGAENEAHLDGLRHVKLLRASNVGSGALHSCGMWCLLPPPPVGLRSDHDRNAS